MIKLLLADDEPLVLVGLQSMLKWEDYNIEVCGAAHNGEQALEMIEKLSPDLVIADIRMPLRSGLEVMKLCREKYDRLPLFIILTSYEEFQYVREAISCQAVDYLVKLELTAESLAKSVTKALELLREFQKDNSQEAPEQGGMLQFYDKFFVRLINGLFENREQYLIQKNELGVDFSSDTYAVCHCEMLGIQNGAMCTEKLIKLYSSTVQMVRETVSKYIPCYVTTLDMCHFIVTLCLSESQGSGYEEQIRGAMEKAVSIVFNYFNVRLLCSVGSIVKDPFALSESYYTARLAFSAVSVENPVAFPEKANGAAGNGEIFDISKYKDSITKAYEELNTETLYDLITQISEYFRDNPERRLQAMDAACNLLYMAISLLPGGEEIISQIFSDDPEGFRSIYKKRTTMEIVSWMTRLRDGLCDTLHSRKQSYKSRIVSNVQKYIRDNLNKKLSLNEVAALFGFSPNYLSQLFTRCTGCSFVEYTTKEKVTAAKEMMAGGNEKIYEIADKLGFESAFYFSKVFKKLEGCSPREYIKIKL